MSISETGNMSNTSSDTSGDTSTMNSSNSSSDETAQSAEQSAVQSTKRAARPIDVMTLYPRDMNIYGDTGNLLVITRRLALYGYQPVVHAYNQGDPWPEHIDLLLGGGGQDSGQRKVQEDLIKRGPQLRDLASAGVPMLLVCGLYQLFGAYFQTMDSDRIPGINVFDMVTIGSAERQIGNIVEESREFGTLVGYENHSGRTFLVAESATKPLALVRKGVGNNPKTGTEGARVHNVIGTYLHGPLLPKNPKIADFLIHTAVSRRYGKFDPQMSDGDRCELQMLDHRAITARRIAADRPR
jgi:CobQ-like glutamine amidotransferase family enzyme